MITNSRSLVNPTKINFTFCSYCWQAAVKNSTRFAPEWLQNASPEFRGGILKWGNYAAFFAAFFFFSSQRTTTASSMTAAAAQTLTLTVVKSRVMLSKPSSSTMAVGST